jgi:membrane-associated protease RseP (regulator of RpoE activity)
VANDPLSELLESPHPGKAERRTVLPLFLFVFTCVSTFWVGATAWKPIFFMDGMKTAALAVCGNWRQGLAYMAAVMAILAAHEMGHFLVARCYRIPTSFPYFLPMPISPLGTFGAVIAMQSTGGNRRQIFDVGIAGPLAGLAVALPILWIGVQRSSAALPNPIDLSFGTPWIARLLAMLGAAHGPELASRAHIPDPFFAAGWVGMFVTGFNMLPSGQFDGGHIIHALLGRRSVYLSRGFLIGAILWVVLCEQYTWIVMVVLLTLIGTDHPPTADDTCPLGWPRRVLGWASLSIPILCLPLA